eukprot:jgi/Mesvir1/7661/Mv11421-RA.1
MTGTYAATMSQCTAFVRGKAGLAAQGGLGFGRAGARETRGARRDIRAAQFSPFGLSSTLQLGSRKPVQGLSSRTSRPVRKQHGSWQVSATLGGSDAPGFLPMGKSLAIDKLRIPTKDRDAVFKAAESLGGRVTLGDVAGAAGVSLSVAEQVLTALASDVNGSLQVSDVGEILYNIPAGFRGSLAARSLAMRLEPALAAVQSVLGYFVRVSFGTALVASVLLVYTAIIVVITSARTSDDDRRSNRDRSYFRGPSLYINPFDLFWYWDPYYYRSRRMRMRQQGDEEMNFFEAVFSFVFGDGDPNYDFEERRWQQIGSLISRNGGVVTAEQLAPYLDPPRLGADELAVAKPLDPSDEGFVLPVLQRFNGHPEIDEQGNILYRFESFQRSAGGRKGGAIEGMNFNEWLGSRNRSSSASSRSSSSTVDFLQEREYQFSLASGTQKVLAAIFGAANFVGVAVLSNLLRNPAIARELGGVVQLAANLLPALQAYAVLFFAIPALRFVWLQRRNAQIGQRNENRAMRAQALARPAASLRRKLLNASEAASKDVITQDRVVYSTDRDVDEQKVDGAADEWERKFRERNRNR